MKEKVATMTVATCGDFVVLDPRWSDWSSATTPEGALNEYYGLCTVERPFGHGVRPLPVRAGSKVIKKLSSWTWLDKRFREWIQGRVFTPEEIEKIARR